MDGQMDSTTTQETTSMDGADTQTQETGGYEEDFSLDYTGEEPSQEAESSVEAEVQPSPSPTSETESGQNLAQVPSQEPAQPQDDIATLQARINDLMGIVAQYESQKLAGGQQPPAQAPQQTPPQPSAQTPSAPAQPTPPNSFAIPKPGEITNLDFIGEGVDHVDILGDRDKFNGLLNKVATVSFTAAMNAAQEQIMMKIPSLVESAAKQQLAAENIAKEFYSQNQDLANFRQAVSMAAVQLYNENPSLPLPDLLKGAAQRTREVLRLSHAQGGGRKRVPAQPAGGSIRSGGVQHQPQTSDPELDEQQRQILDLISF